MKIAVVMFATLVCVCLSIPVHDAAKTLSVEDDLETQALIAMQKVDAPGKYKNFLPLLSHVVVYASSVLPSVRANKEHKHNNELTASFLVQTMTDSVGVRSELEKGLPTGESMMDAMIALGNVMGGSSGYNPITMMSNVVGKKEMGDMIDELLKFPLEFPDPDEKQLQAAEQVVLTVGLGFGDQEYAINHFLDSLSPKQKEMISSLQKNVLEKTLNAMTTPSGDPSPALIEEIKRQLREMEQRKGTTEFMPDEFKDLVRESMKKGTEATSQALISIHADSTATSKFQNFIPLVNQAVVYAGAVLPSIKANKQHKAVHELSDAMLVQTIAEAAGTNSSDLEKYLPTSDDMLDAMVKIGRVLGGQNGFNPIQMMTNIVGEKDMKQAIDEIMHFPLRFPDLTDQQLMVAEEVVLSVGLGFQNQEQAVDTFIAALNEEQRRMVVSMQKNVVEKLVNSMMLPNGDPSPKLIEEIKKEMREMEKNTGSSDQMPPELKALVNESASEKKAQ